MSVFKICACEVASSRISPILLIFEFFLVQGTSLMSIVYFEPTFEVFFVAVSSVAVCWFVSCLRHRRCRAVVVVMEAGERAVEEGREAGSYSELSV